MGVGGLIIEGIFDCGIGFGDEGEWSAKSSNTAFALARNLSIFVRWLESRSR